MHSYTYISRYALIHTHYTYIYYIYILIHDINLNMVWFWDCSMKYRDRLSSDFSTLNLISYIHVKHYNGHR